MLSFLARPLADFLKEHYKDVGLLVGGTWALYNLLQRGSLHPLLDLTVSGKLIRSNERQYLLASMEAQNVHVPLVKLKLCALRVSSKRESDTGTATELSDWKQLATFRVFEQQDKIWARETIRGETLVTVPSEERVFNLEFRVFRKQWWEQRPYRWLSFIPRLPFFAPKGQSWYAVAIVEGLSKAEETHEGNHPSGARSNREGNEGLGESDRGDDEKE